VDKSYETESGEIDRYKICGLTRC